MQNNTNFLNNMSLSKNELDLLTIHNKIIPKDKLISLEQFYKLSVSQSNENAPLNAGIKTMNIEISDLDDLKKEEATNRKIENNSAKDLKMTNLKVDHFKFINNSKINTKVLKQNSNNGTATPTNLTQNGSSNTVKNYLLNNTNKVKNGRSGSSDGRKSVLQLQNQNLVLNSLFESNSHGNNASTSLNTNLSNETTNKQNRHKNLRNKVFSVQTDQTDDEVTATLQQNSLNTPNKLSYLKRYVANGLAANKNGSTQFADGYWGKKPLSDSQPKLKMTTIRTSNPSTAGATNASNSVLSSINLNSINLKSQHASKASTNGPILKKQTNPSGSSMVGSSYNPNQASVNSNQREKELTIIDLQLPIKNQSQSGAFISQSQQNQIKSKRLVTRNMLNNNNNSEYYSASSEFNANEGANNNENNYVNLNYADPSLGSYLMQIQNLANKKQIENMDIQNSFGSANGGAGANLENLSNENNYEKTSNFTINQQIESFRNALNNSSNTSNNNQNNYLNNYLNNQHKKKLYSANSANRIDQMTNATSRKNANQNQQTNIHQNNNLCSHNSTEVLVTSSLNNLSSNALLIKRLKF